MLGRMLRGEVEPGVEVTAGAYRGKVIAIGSLFTTLETPQGIVKVPKSQLTSQAVQMDQGQYQWQVQKREELKQQAMNGMRQHGNQAQPGSRLR
jgi:hypothetical protein